MKFKVGDRVKVISGLNDQMQNVVVDMEKYAGKTAVVEAVGDTYYKLDVDGQYWNWEDSFLEPAPFTLSDLKPYMVVRVRDGELLMVSQTEKKVGIINRAGGSLDFTNYDKEMKYISECVNPEKYDIIEVYNLTKDYLIYSLEISINNRELLWKREEPKPKRKMTVAEICEELGEEIEIVKGD